MISNFIKCLLILVVYNFTQSIAVAQLKPRGKGSSKFYPGSKIEIVYDDKQQPYEYRIVKGKNIVFEYIWIAADDSMIADDEYREKIVFEIPAGRKSFVLKDAELRKANSFFYWSCFCPNAGNHVLERGTINGKRFGRNSWLLNVDVSYFSVEFPDWPKTLQIDQRYFVKSKLSSRKEW